ncbi:MAG: UvrB/UvrC motif-containing protein [Candidatus Brocadiales bacterium]
MKCESCNKRHATVHLTEISGNEKREQHLCDECAHNLNNQLVKMPSPADILTSLINQVAPEIGEMSKTSCPACGMSYLEFRSSGRLGCPMDYMAFKKGLNPLLEKMHGASQHIGKVPSRAGKELVVKNEVLQLRKELDKAVEKEDYEKAARIRDRIFELSGSDDVKRTLQQDR